MSIFKLSYFGEIDLESVKDYYCIDVKIGGKEIEIDINFEGQKTDKRTAEIVEHFLSRIEEIHKANIKEYEEDFKRKGETDEYILYYLEDLEEEEVKELVDRTQDEATQKQELLNKLELKRVGLYPKEENEPGYFGVFDYSIKIDGEYCDQLLVLKTDEKGGLDYITLES